jgi:hypothetical protein
MVAKSYMTNGLQYHLNFLIYEVNFVFFFISDTDASSLPRYGTHWKEVGNQNFNFNLENSNPDISCQPPDLGSTIKHPPPPPPPPPPQQNK